MPDYDYTSVDSAVGALVDSEVQKAVAAQSVVDATALSKAVAAQRDADSADYTRLLADYAKYKKDHPPTVAPPLWGANYSDDPNVDESLYKGKAQTARIFLQGLSDVTWSSIKRVQRAAANGITTFVVSWKDRDANNVKAFLATIPDGLTIYACFNHEPEDDSSGPGTAGYAAWSKEWKRQWTIQSPLIRARGFIPIQILMGYTLRSASKRNFLNDWLAPKGTVDVLGWDAYFDKYDPAEQIANIVAAGKAAGIKEAMIAETGSHVDDAQRSVKMSTMRQAILDANDAGDVHFCVADYWNSKMPDIKKSDGTIAKGADFRLNQKDAAIWFSGAAA